MSSVTCRCMAAEELVDDPSDETLVYSMGDATDTLYADVRRWIDAVHDGEYNGDALSRWTHGRYAKIQEVDHETAHFWVSTFAMAVTESRLGWHLEYCDLCGGRMRPDWFGDLPALDPAYRGSEFCRHCAKAVAKQQKKEWVRV